MGKAQRTRNDNNILRERQLQFVSAEQSASEISWRDHKGVVGEHDGAVESVVLDTIDNVEGMEFLLGIAVGIERRIGTDADGPFSEPGRCRREWGGS